jgi:hypothetical protein
MTAHVIRLLDDESAASELWMRLGVSDWRPVPENARSARFILNWPATRESEVEYRLEGLDAPEVAYAVLRGCVHGSAVVIQTPERSLGRYVRLRFHMERGVAFAAERPTAELTVHTDP